MVPLIDYAGSLDYPALAVRLGLPLLTVTALIVLWLLPGWLARTGKKYVYSYIEKHIRKGCKGSDVRFTTTAQGYRIQGFSADSGSLQFSNGPYEISCLEVAELELQWPSWQHQRLRIHVTGLHLDLLQRRFPLVPVSPPDLAAAGQLVVLEGLLWHDSSSSAGSQGSSTTWLRDWFLKAALGRVELQLQDCRVQYVAPGQLGPAAAGKPVQLKDAIAISVRSAVLAPAGISSDAAANAASDVAGGGMGAPLGQGSFRTSAAKQLITQLTVTGVSIALASSQGDVSASSAPDTMPLGQNSSRVLLGTADLATSLWREGWSQVHVLLLQWQCSISVYVPCSSHKHSKNGVAYSDGVQELSQQQTQPAVSVRFKKAGVVEVADGVPPEQSPASWERDVDGSPQSLQVNVQMKSFVLSVPPIAAAIGSRLLSRHSKYKLLSPLWSSRPRQPVSASPAVWWQHACNVVLAECRRRRPPCSLRLALLRRRRYVSLYRALHSQQPGYLGSRRKEQHTDVAAAQKALKTLESTMTACEVATHRIFVALVHSKHLQRHPVLQQQWIEALDGLGGFVDLIPGKGQEASRSKPGLAVSLSCPAISVRLTSNHQPHTAQLIAEAHRIELLMPSSGGAAAVVQQVQLSVRRNPGIQSTRTAGSSSSEDLIPVLSLPHSEDSETAGRPSVSSQQQAVETGTTSAPRPSKLGRIYPDSLVATYLSHYKVRLGGILLQLQPQLIEGALDYYKAIKVSTAVNALGHNDQDTVVPVKQMVLDAFKHHRVALSFALSALLPMLDVTCPQLSVIAPLKHVHQLDGVTSDAQTMPESSVQLVLRMQQLHASVGYNSSCYSSLLQQVDATADIDVLFQQQFNRPSLAQQHMGQYGMLWMHPDDAAQLGPAHYSPAPAFHPRRSFASSMLRAGAAGLNTGVSCSLSGAGGLNRSAVASTLPYVPVLKMRRLWTRLSTHIPTEAAVAGGEHTAAGLSVAGLLGWLSPWQVRLLVATVDQMAADGQAMWQRLQATLHTAHDSVIVAASNAAAASAVQTAIDEAQEIGSAAAAASKAATAVVQTAGVMAPSALIRESSPVAEGSSKLPYQRQPDFEHDRQQPVSAKEASRTAAKQASISLLCMLPYCEVLGFADLGSTSSNAGSDNNAQHRYRIRLPAVSRSSNIRYPGLDTQPQQQPAQQTHLLQRWAAQIAPVASLVLHELKAGSTTAADGALEAKMHLSAVMLVNLQLLDLCKSATTMPTAAGVYLPAGYTIPKHSKQSAIPPVPAYIRSSVGGLADPVVDRAAQDGNCAVGLAANHNAFVLSTFTSRLTTTYQMAALSRWQLLGLSHLAVGVGGNDASLDGVNFVNRGSIGRKLLVRKQWQQTLELRAFARTLDYAMFLLFQQGDSWQAENLGLQSEANATAAYSRFDEYQMLYRHCLPGSAVGGLPAAAEHSPTPAWLLSKRSSSSVEAAVGSAAGLQPGSPCNWKSNSFHRRKSERLVVVEQLSSPESESSSIDGSGMAGRLSKQQQQRLHKARYPAQAAAPAMPGTAVGRLRAAASTPGPLAPAPTTASGSLQQVSKVEPQQHTPDGPVSAAADPTGSGPAETGEQATPVKGMKVFAALRSLRSGSQELLQRLWRHKQAQQQAAAAAAAGKGKYTSKASRMHTLGNGLPSAGHHQSGNSQWQPTTTAEGMAAQHQRQSLVDFLERFTVRYVAVDPAAVANSSGSRYRRNSSGMISASLGTSDSWTSRSTRVLCSQQPQLTVAYQQKPVQQQHQQPVTSRGQALLNMQEPEDVLDVALCHMKVTLGPHSVSMMLQLLTSLSAAAKSRQTSRAVRQQVAATQVPKQHSSMASGGLRVNFQLALCHVLLNMERTLLPGQLASFPGVSGELQTKALMSLLLLDANTSVLHHTGGLGRPTDDADSRQYSGVEAACSAAHIGIQDLCACEEHRRVLSGADEPCRAGTVADNFMGRLSRPQAACSLSVHTLLPAAGGDDPGLIAVAVFNPKLLLLRRFANDLLYVTALINHEVAASKAQSPTGSSQKQKAARVDAAAASPVLLVTLHNVQLILPRSHACKTLVDKYAAAEQIHKDAEQQRQQQAADQRETSGAGWGGNSTHSTHGGSSSAGNDARQGSNFLSDYSYKKGPLHAQFAEVMVLQASSITVAAPADPVLLQQVHTDLAAGPQNVGAANAPLWMREAASVRQLIANSRAIMTCSGAPNSPDVPQQQPATNTADIASASTAAAGPADEAAVAAPTAQAADPQLQPAQPLEDKKHVQFTVGRQQKPAAAVRHGVLLVAEDDASASRLDEQLAPVPTFSLGVAAGRLWKSFVTRIKPRRRRLVVRPDSIAEVSAAAAGVADSGARSAAAASAFSRAGQLGSPLQASDERAAGADDECSGALLLMDFHGMELFAGKMLREQDIPGWRSAGLARPLFGADMGGGSHEPVRCSLTQLVHMITRANFEMVVYQHAVSTPAVGHTTAAPPPNIIALSASDGLALQFSNSSYRCLMDTLYGNLMYYYSTFQAGSIKVNPPPVHQTSFQPNLVFGPKPGQLPNFGLTLSSSAIQGTLWADQRWWTPCAQPQPQHSFQDSPFAASSSGGGSSVVPFVSALWQEASLCVQFMKGSNDMHVNLYAQDTEWRDVRMANKEADGDGASFRRAHQLVGRRAEYQTAHDELRRMDNLKRFEQLRQDGGNSSLGGTVAPATSSSGQAARLTRSTSGYEASSAAQLASAAVDEELQLLEADGLHGEDSQQYMSPGRSPVQRSGSTKPINLHPRPERLTPRSESEDDDGSVQGVSSEDTVGEQRLDVFDLYPALLQPSAEGLEEVPDLSIIRVLDELPAEESAHLPNKGKRLKPNAAAGPGSGAFKFHMGYLKEGTMTVEVTLASTLVQWPYLSDMSLVSAIINIFYNDWGAAPKLPPAWLQLKRNAWLYFNLVITDSQIFMPLLTPHMMPDSSLPGLAPDLAQSPYEVLRDVVMRQASLTGEDIDSGRGQPLQQMGLALTFGAFRFGYFYGGDGEAIMRFDVRNLAGFVRDTDAVITNWLLPLPSARLEMRYDWPMVEEHKALQPLLMISRRMVLYHAIRKRERRRKQREARAAAGLLGAASSGRLQVAEPKQKHQGHGQDKQDSASGSYTTSAARAAAAAASTPEQRLLALACEHAEEMFGERVIADFHNTWARSHGGAQPAQASTALFGQSSSGMFGVYKRKARSELVLTTAPVTVRAAFSNINTWKTLQADMDFAGRARLTGLGMWPPRPDIQAEVLAVRAAGGVWPPPLTGWAAEFRRSSSRQSIEVAALMLMLCDDKPHSFGAPDVLQAMARGVSFVHAVEYRYPRTAPERADRLHVDDGVGMSILNNSNSKWEVLLEPWPLLVSLSDPINPLSKADRTISVQALSSEPLRVNFHPSSLLSIGDLLAFIREVSAAPASSTPQPQPGLASAHSTLLLEEAPSLQMTGVSARHEAAGVTIAAQESLRRAKPQNPTRGLNHTEAPPSIEQQMALGEGVSSRIPQRYLIQNLTGSHLYYWSPAEESSRGMHGAKRRVLLPAHSIQELKVTPAARRMEHVGADGSLLSSGVANAICLQLAGSWLPLEAVAVDVVGKYRYEVRDPLGGACLPLLLDVLLVGRTKMLRLHSCIWLENNTSMKLEPCVQLGNACTTPVVLGPGDKLDSMQRLHLRPLKPKEGRFLPAAAAIGGLLFLAPEGHLPTEHDVLRLDVSLKALSQQQGYIRCQSKPDGIQHGPLHLAATIRQGLQTDPYFTTQNLTEVPRPGTLRKARTALEASIHINPTLQLANGLPYDVLGWALVPPGRDVGRLTPNPQAGSNPSTTNRVSDAAAKLKHKLSQAGKTASSSSNPVEQKPVRSDGSHARTSFTGAASVAQAAAVAAAAAAGGNNVAGLQQVLAAGDRRAAAMALGSAVAASGSPMRILEQLSLVDANTASPSTPAAQVLRNRRGSWFGGVSGSGSLLEHSAEGLAVQRRRAASILSPTPQTSFRPLKEAADKPVKQNSAELPPSQQAEKLHLSQACELLLLQRWCRDLLLEEFLTTLHLVLSPTLAAKVDVAALWLLDLPSLVALALGVLAEEFGWIAKSFPQAFSLILKVEEAMASSGHPSSSSEAPGTSALQAHQLPWPADQLPIAELFDLLHWMQQGVVRLQLAPGGTADLYLDPQLEVYAALRVPVLGMQSRPTLVAGGAGSHILSGSDSLWLSYTAKLDSGHSSQQQSNSISRQSLAGTEASFAGQPRLGLSGLEALEEQATMHEEVTIRMTDVVRQLSELASRQKISPYHARAASYHGVGINLGANNMEELELSGLGTVPLSALAAGSAVVGHRTNLYQASQSLQPWASAPGVLPVSFAASSGSQTPLMQQQPLAAAAADFESHAELLSWFAVVVELLGDIVRLAAHEAEVLQQTTAAGNGRCSPRRRRFAPEQLMDELELADIALLVLGDSLHQQAAQAAGSAGLERESTAAAAARGQSVVNSSIQLPGEAGQAGMKVDVAATMVSVCDVLLKPPGDIDRIFTQFNLNKGHVLTDEEMQALLRFSCRALIDHLVTVAPAVPEVPDLPQLPQSRFATSPTPTQPSGPRREISSASMARRPRFATASSDNETSLLLSPRSSGSLSFSPQPSYTSPSGTVRHLSRLQQPAWHDNDMYNSSPADSAAPSLPQTPVPTAPPSTPRVQRKPKFQARSSDEDSPQQQQQEEEQQTQSEPQQSVDNNATANSSITLGGIEHHDSTATSPRSSTSGSGPGGAVKGFRSLRSLWPPRVGTSSAGGKAAAGTDSRADELRAEQHRASTGEDSGESSEEEITLSPRPRESWQGSFRRRPGASVKHLARAMGRATGAPVRLVHGQLSDQLRAALDRKMRATPPHLLPPGVISGRYNSPSVSAPAGPGSGVLRQQSHQWWTMTLQALGRGAVAAEVHEGRPGFCAPHNLKLSLVTSGGNLDSTKKGSRTGGSRSSGAGNINATLHVLLTASFWLDNRSGLNLVLSDLDRKILKGLPGPQLKNTADVHSPGLPHDCAALEAAEPDLSTLLANSNSQDDLADAAADPGRAGKANQNTEGSEADLEAALSRLQEVRPALLNDQSWLRFWVEEHVILPPGSRPVRTKSRRTFSFNKTPAGLVSALSSAGTGSPAESHPAIRSSAPLEATDAASLSGQVQAIRSQPSNFFKIAITGHKTDIQVKGKKSMVQLWAEPSPALSGTHKPIGAADAETSDQQLLGRAALAAFSTSDPISETSSGEAVPSPVWDPAIPVIVPVQRLYEFAVEVWPTPAEGPFRAAKIVSIKSKYILFNDTGMVLEYKQKGTPDPNHPAYKYYGDGRRFAGLLQPQERVAFHWDNVAEPRLLLIRPAASGWPWSGAFPLLEKEDYIGLRLRNRCSEDAVIIPVNTTVGRSGSVLVTFKSTNSVPPLRIENRTKSVTVMLRQHLDAMKGPGVGTPVSTALPARKESSPRVTIDLPAGWAWDSLAPGSSIPFAWDDVTGTETVEVAAGVLGAGVQRADQILAAGKRNMWMLDLDAIQKKPHVMTLRPVTMPSRGTRITAELPSTAAPAPAAAAVAASANPAPSLGASRAGSVSFNSVMNPRSPSMTQQQQQQQQRPMKPMLSIKVGPSGGAGVGGHAQPKDGRSSSAKEHSVRETAATSPATTPGAETSPHTSHPELRAAAKVKGTLFDKKMYVSLYADGPTRVLCFSDSPIAGSDPDEEGGSQQLMSRLHQVARQLMQVDRQLAAYLGSSYAMRAARGSRAVPAMLLLQQQQQARAAAPGVQLPGPLHNTASSWHTSGTTTAAVALLQQMGLRPPTPLGAGGALPGGPGRSSGVASAHWTGSTHVPDPEAGQTHVGQSLSEPAFSQASQSIVSHRTAAGAAAAAAAAGVRITDGVLSVDAAEGGLRLYYDKLTLLLDSGLPLGGNCKVKLLSARGLVPAGAGDRFYGYQARMAVSGRRPVLSGVATAARDQQEVLWDHEEQFTKVTAISEFVLEIWGIPNANVFARRGNSAGQAPAGGRYVRSQGGLPTGSVFLGAVQIPLIHTLPGTNTGGKEPQWHSLLRVRGDQQVSGQVQLSVAWSFTRETLLATQLSVLEHLLEARQEVLALLRPLSSSKVARIVGLTPTDGLAAAGSQGAACEYPGADAIYGLARQRSMYAGGDDADSVVSEDAYGEPGVLMSAGSSSLEHGGITAQHQGQQHGKQAASFISWSNVFAGLDLGMADSSVVTLEVDVIEVANLSPRSGWSQDLTRALLSSAGAGNNSGAANNANLMLSETVKSSDLPLPVVYVFCGTGQSTDEGFEVASGVHTLNPCFGRTRHQFKQVGLRSVVRVLVYDRHSALDSRLLGLGRLPAASIPAGSGPVYMWLPLSPPPRKAKDRLARLQAYMPGAVHGLDAANRVSFSGVTQSAPTMQPCSPGHTPHAQQQLQVLLRVRVKKPATHNTTASMQANLAGLLLNAKTPGGDELLNLTVDTVQCAMLTTTRERQFSVSVRSVQLDNQLLETRQPVVLSPATMGEELVGYNLPKDKHRITLPTDKTLDDMESPARAMFAAVANIANSSGTSQPAANSRQLQVTSSGSSLSAAARKVPLIRLSVCQTITKTLNDSEHISTSEGAKQSMGKETAMAEPAAGSSSSVGGSSAASAGTGGVQSKSAVSKAAIMSFRKVELLMGGLDLKTDQAFLEGVLQFVQSMPLADLWQDAAWQQHVALLQGAGSSGSATDHEQQQQSVTAALVGRRSTVTALPPSATLPAGSGPRQQLSAAAAAARIHAQQWHQQQQQVVAAHSPIVHGRSRSVGSVPNDWDLHIDFQQLAASAAGPAASGSLAQQGSAASTSAAVSAAKAARKAAAARRAALNSILVLAWLPGKHDQELNSMKGQSSTWYFLEKLYVSALCMNVTIALTSSIRTAATGSSTGPAAVAAAAAGAREGLGKAMGSGFSEVQRTVVRGMVSRLSGGNNGLQLINVSDVALRLSSFKLENRLLNQVGLNSELYRHYFWAALAELRKVLGGAGPGLVQLPASIIWAGFSVVDLVLELQQGRRKPLHSAFALMHVAFTLLSQLSGVATRFIVSMYALMPVQRQGTLSDHSALQRYVRMPATAGEAFYQAVAELYLGTAAGVLGLFLDPAAGLHLPGALGVAGALVGLMKGAGGLMVRPAMGILDAISKCLKGIGLLFLGRRGIQGKLVRRVRPPGALEGPVGLAGSSLPGGPGRQLGSPGRRLDDAALHDALVASWQARLPALSAELEGDQVVDLMGTRSCRLLLLTRHHVLYLRASVPTKGQRAGSYSYSIRWLLPCSRVDHVRGEEERLKIVLEYHSQLRVPQISSWRQRAAARAKAKKADGTGPATPAANAADVAEALVVQQQQQGLQIESVAAAGSHLDSRVLLRIPLQRSLRCASPELYQQVIRAISRHLVQMASTAPGAKTVGVQAGQSALEPAVVAGFGPGGSRLQLASADDSYLYTVA